MNGIFSRRNLAILFALALAGCYPRLPAQVVFVPPPPAAQETPASAFETIEVQRGDTIYALAAQHGVTMRALIDANDLRPPYVLRLGQRLAVPRGNTHVVQRGETLFEISRRYGVDSYALAQANGLAPPYGVAPGQELRIPAALPSAAPAVETMPEIARPPNVSPGPAPIEAPAARPAAPPMAPQAMTVAPPPPPPPPPPPSRGEQFAWPLHGKLLSGFGPKPGGLHNDGINIAARKGEPVRAADNGTVVYAGNELKGFGNLVLLRHADGWVTAYAHNDRIGVTRGATVRRGQVIAHAGQSGSVTSPQLHFEIRQGNQPVDPVRYLAGVP